MKSRFTPRLYDDIDRYLDDAVDVDGIINIPRVAEEIRKRNERLNIALEDITTELMRRALARNALMEFDSAFA
jgi:hypothetical protein